MHPQKHLSATRSTDSGQKNNNLFLTKQQNISQDLYLMMQVHLEGG